MSDESDRTHGSAWEVLGNEGDDVVPSLLEYSASDLESEKQVGPYDKPADASSPSRIAGGPGGEVSTTRHELDSPEVRPWATRP